MARKIFLIISILAFSFGSAKLSSALFFCNEKPTCCSHVGMIPCAHAKQIPFSAKYPAAFGQPIPCSCELKKETASDSCDFVHQHRELAKVRKQLKFVTSPFPNVLAFDKIKAEDENLSPPKLHHIFPIQDPPLRC
jgi:hypothetical protein